jgi:ArsR family transcriptional regulator
MKAVSIINKQQKVEIIKEDFKSCQKVFLAIGNETPNLREAGIIMVREEGSKNYYFMDVRTKLGVLKNLINHLDEFMEQYY